MSATSASSGSTAKARRTTRSCSAARAPRTPRSARSSARAFHSEVVDAVENVVATYIAQRESASEPFLDTYRRVGPAPFKEALYGAA